MNNMTSCEIASLVSRTCGRGGKKKAGEIETSEEFETLSFNFRDFGNRGSTNDPDLEFIQGSMSIY